MDAYLVITEAPAGPRGRVVTEKWIVMAGAVATAWKLAIEYAHPNARVKSCEIVDQIKRVSIS